jgi:hypothetical protein
MVVWCGGSGGRREKMREREREREDDREGERERGMVREVRECRISVCSVN